MKLIAVSMSRTQNPLKPNHSSEYCTNGVFTNDHIYASVNKTVVTKFSWLRRSIAASIANGMNPIIPIPVSARNIPKTYIIFRLSTSHMPRSPTIAVHVTMRIGSSNFYVLRIQNEQASPDRKPEITKTIPIMPTLTLSTSKTDNNSYINESKV